MKYPIGIQNFDKIRTDGYAYVDKTQHIYNLVNTGQYYFLSRPRRFGKSLLLSTIRAYFEGKKELFEGLALGRLEERWEQYPILYLDLNVEEYNNTESLHNRLSQTLSDWEEMYGIPNGNDKSLSLRFEKVIKNTSTAKGKRVVILVDEYDKPMLQAIDNEALLAEFRSTLKAFYSNLKSCDEYIKFAFLTGVTKFGKVSIFSDLNHLTDISLLPQFANICGITDEELHDYFDEGIQELADANGMNKKECYAKLKRDFEGYHFYPNSNGLYNPFSLLNTLAYKVFKDYWFETGTPTFLVKQLQKTDYPLEEMTREGLTADTLNSIDIMDENPLPLMFQSGYLTIKDYYEEFGEYQLGFPNREVEEGFTKFLYPYYAPNTTNNKSNFSIIQFVNDVRNGDAEGFMKRLEALFADGDYQIMGVKEIYFQNTLYVFFKLLGFYVEVERHTSDGRMDILMQTKEYVYILELKVDKTAAVALQQIEDKGYAVPFAKDPRKLFMIGVNFDLATRKIDDWKVRSMSNGKDESVASYRSIIKKDVFICYSRKDYVDEHNNVIPNNEMSKIMDALTKADITYWLEEINKGDKFAEKIVNSIEISKVFLFLSTKNSCESTWTSKEIAGADEFGKYIIHVRIDKTPYNKQVVFRNADLSYVDYEKNPEKGRQEIVNSIKAYLEKKIKFTVGDVDFRMIKVEGGDMGTFYIGETQVTQALWQAVMGNNPSWFEGQEHPVECVSWNDICGKDRTGTDPNCFLYKLNQETGKNFRLPKEAEREYAAKGGNKSKNYTYAGSDDIDKVAWYVGNSKNSTHSVKQLSPNELGIYDMSGNVWEWCEDKYEPSSSHRVLRGGSWSYYASYCRVSSRNYNDPDGRDFNIGFRLVLPQ